MDIFLRISNIDFSYPGHERVLRGVSLEVQRGEVVALVGPSGAGKSTLLRCVRGLLTPTSGEISIRPHGEEDFTPAALGDHRIAMVFQGHNLVLNRSALWNVLVGRLSALPRWRSYLGFFGRENKTRGRQILSSVRLDGYSSRLARHLSGGQFQRVGIARALAQEPQLLLADEPTASLDSETAESLMELFAEISRRSGLTILMAIHNPYLARKYCDHVVNMTADGVVDSPLEPTAAGPESTEGTSDE